jgi:DNA modification methylase
VIIISDIQLYNGDCLEIMDQLIKKNQKIQSIIVDPPYGTIKGIKNVNHGLSGKTEWDNKIDIQAMFDKCEKLLIEQGSLIIFAQDPFTTELICNSKKQYNINFCYRYIYEKKHHANSLMAKKAPLNYFEDVLVFRRKYDIYNENPLRAYFEKILNCIGKSLHQINLDIGNRSVEHSFYIKSHQFKLCSKKSYDKLCSLYNLKQQAWFKNYNEIQKLNIKPIFNLPNNKKYKSNILKYTISNKEKGFHPTQKPVLLLEDLIKTYTNEGDYVLDFAMGSGSTGVACKNLNRNFIGIELDKNYFNIAKQRIGE